MQEIRGGGRYLRGYGTGPAASLLAVPCCREGKSPWRQLVLSFPLPCLLQSCWNVCRPAWAGSGASAGHGIGWKMHYHMGCAQLLDVGCWVQSWGYCMLPWQGVGRGSHTTPGVMSCSSGWVGVPGSRDSWGGCSTILGGAASLGLILPARMWRCTCGAEPCAPLTAAHVRLGVLQDQHKKCCGEQGVASPSSSSSSSSSSTGSGAQQHKPQLC